MKDKILRYLPSFLLILITAGVLYVIFRPINKSELPNYMIAQFKGEIKKLNDQISDIQKKEAESLEIILKSQEKTSQAISEIKKIKKKLNEDITINSSRDNNATYEFYSEWVSNGHKSR